MNRTLAIFQVLLFCTLIANAQDQEIFQPDSIKRQLRAYPISTSLKVDGQLSEPEWKLAPDVSDFIQIEPVQGERAQFQTIVKALYNKQFLYFGIFCKDSLGKNALRATDYKRDFNSKQHDHLSLTFDGFNDQRNAMAFVTNAYGVQRDLLSFDDLLVDVDWDGLWKVRTNRTDSGWYAELAIPWQTLRYPKSEDSLQHWGFNVYRNRRLTNEGSAFSPYPRSLTPLRMAYAGQLTHLKPPPPGPNIRLQPYWLGSSDWFHNYPNTQNPKTGDSKLGGDLKWAINSNSILDLTLNTDFAQADADRQVNNVSRFSVFFPERRQFFLENASLFGVGVGPNDDMSGGNMRIKPFFSRRIGLDEAGNPLPIDGGARFVHRSNKRNFGALLMRQREWKDNPTTHYFVGRYSENLGEQNRLGALVTIKSQPGQSNIVSAVDGFFRLGARHSLNTMVIHSATSANRTQGMAGYAQYYYTTNRWKIWWTQSVVTKNFNPEMGFISRSDVIGTTPGIFWYYRGKYMPWKKINRAFEPGIMTEFYHQASTGKLLERQININPIWFNFQNGGFFGYLVNPTYQLLTEPFAPLGVNISEGKYNYTRHQFYASTDPSRMFNLFLQYETGKYFNGKLDIVDTRLQFSPIPNVSLTARAVRNKFWGVGNLTSSALVNLYSMEGRLALNPRLQLAGFYQLNSENSFANVNIRLSWEYRPLSYIYLVYNRRAFDNTLLKRQSDDHLIAKLSYLRQL